MSTKNIDTGRTVIRSMKGLDSRIDRIIQLGLDGGTCVSGEPMYRGFPVRKGSTAENKKRIIHWIDAERYHGDNHFTRAMVTISPELYRKLCRLHKKTEKEQAIELENWKDRDLGEVTCNDIGMPGRDGVFAKMAALQRGTKWKIVARRTVDSSHGRR